MRPRVLFKRIVLHILAVLGYLAGLPLWRVLAGKRREIRILRYHSISNDILDDMNVTPAFFEKHLDFVSKRYDVISMDKALAHLSQGRLPLRPSVVLTFDDGYKDNYEVLLPILRSRNLHATIFLLTGDKNGERKAYHLSEEFCDQHPLLSWQEAKSLKASGVTIGSHGESHARLKNLSAEESWREIMSSRQRLEAETGGPTRYFSYPYGTCEDFDAETKNFVRAAGYEAAFSAMYGSNGIHADRYALKRMGVEASDSLFTLRAKLNGALGLVSLFDIAPVRRAIRRFDAFFVKRARPVRNRRPLLLVSVDFPPHTDGVSTIAREISDRIAKRDQKVMVIGPKDRGDLEFDSGRPYRVFRVPGYDWGYLRMVPLVFCMVWVILRYRIRHVFAMNIAYGGLVSWFFSHFLPLRYILFAYGYEFEKVRRSRILCSIYRRIYGRARSIVCCSEAVRDRLVEFGAGRAQTEVIYPAVDSHRFSPRSVSDVELGERGLKDRRILLTVGRLIERKGHDLVLRALPRIVECVPNVTYCIVGSGSYETELRQLADKLSVSKHVRFLGRVSDGELSFLYNACEVFVMPSREIEAQGHVEGFGIVYLEANACAKPVVGGNSGGIREAIREAETGFLVDPQSPDQLADRILFLLTNPGISQEMGQRGFEWVKRNFNWNQYAERVLCLLAGDPGS